MIDIKTNAKFDFWPTVRYQIWLLDKKHRAENAVFLFGNISPSPFGKLIN
jgi:hypothetical protein